MIIFYCENIQACPELSEEDSGHAVRVLRHVEGDKIMVVDGAGHFYQCAITAAHPKHCGLQILSVEEEQHWPYSVELGIAPTKTLAKIASKLCKKYPKLQGGCYMYRPQDIEKVLRRFPAADVWGIGRRSVKKLALLGVSTAWEYVQLKEYDVRKQFALPGWRTWKELQGVPCVEFEDYIEPKQSICVSRSFAKEIRAVGELCGQVATFAESAVTKLRRQGSLALEMAVFALTNRFHEDDPQTFASQVVVFPDGTDDHATVVMAAADAVRTFFNPRYGYKKAGVVFTRITPKEGHTGSLFRDADADARDARLSLALDTLTATYGPGKVLFGIQGDGKVQSARQQQSPRRTTCWGEIPHVTVK